jgi:hypothetical protein
MPGEPPGNITDQELAAMREGRQDINSNISTGGSVPASSMAAGDAVVVDALREEEAKEAAGGSGGAAAAAGGVEAGRGGSNAPGDDPQHIKQVVQEETLHGQE